MISVDLKCAGNDYITMTLTKTYTPYTAEFQSGDRFEIKFKDKLIVAEGRQRDDALIRSTVDLLNAAFSFGVQDVQDQVDPVLNDYKKEIEELNRLVATANDQLVEVTNRYFGSMATVDSVSPTPVATLFDVDSETTETTETKVDECTTESPKTAVSNRASKKKSPTKKTL